MSSVPGWCFETCELKYTKVQSRLLFYMPGKLFSYVKGRQWRTEGGWGFNPPPKIPKALQNRAKLNPIVKTVKKITEFRTPTPQDVRKKRSKILKLPRFTIVLH